MPPFFFFGGGGGFYKRCEARLPLQPYGLYKGSQTRSKRNLEALALGFFEFGVAPQFMDADIELADAPAYT